MKKIVLAASALLWSAAVWSQNNDQAKPTLTREVGQGKLMKVTGKLRDQQPNAAMNSIIVRDENGVRWPTGRKPISPIAPAPDDLEKVTDPARQTRKDLGDVSKMTATLGTNFNGIGYSFVNPPDPTVAAGPNHVIQMINGGSGALYQIYNKSGVALNASAYLDNLTGQGGLGDPIVLYDHLADRFVMTEFANSGETGSEGLIMAVSQTPDPLGSWFVYYFSTGTVFPDYPKFSVWPDGYYCTTNDFGAQYEGSSVFAFDRARMLAGQPLTSYQRVRFLTTSYTKYFAMSPVLLQGAGLPPAGTGGLIAYMVDDVWSATTADRDSIGLLEYDVNWSNPAASVLSNPSSIATVAFTSSVCTATRGQCIPQPGTTSRLEALHQRVMNQPVYRNFAGTAGIVFASTVNVGSSVAGIRWFEMRNTGGPWSLRQEGTFAPADGIFRWMPSIAYDANGNMGMAYNVSNGTSVFPGVRFTGRLAGDPLGTMTQGETVIINGASRNSSTRYGDYNHVVADPNGNSFWMTAQWNNTTQWSTRVASFSITGTVTPTCDAPASLASSNITTSSATISWGAVASAVSYTVEYKLSSATNWTTAASATTSTSLNLTSLAANSTYDWRVSANCSEASSTFASAQFTTQAVTPTCTDAFEPNDVSTQAASLTPGNTISALICTTTDRDWYTFKNNNSTRWVRVTLTVPAGVNYDMRLIRPNGAVAGTTSGTSSTKVITYNNNRTGAYRVEVYSTTGSSTTASYTLRPQISGSSTFPAGPEPAGPDANLIVSEGSGVTIAPNPATGLLNIRFDARSTGTATLKMVDMQGRPAAQRNLGVKPGVVTTTWDVSRLRSGTYTLQVQEGNRRLNAKVVLVQ